MAKEIKVTDGGADPTPAPEVSDREKRWQAYVANYAKSNPVKYASKNANHEFDKVPDAFK